MSYYLPSGDDTDAFGQELIFLNLWGDCTQHDKQTHILAKISSVIMLVIEAAELTTLKAAVKSLLGDRTIVLMTTKCDSPGREQSVRDGYNICKDMIISTTSSTYQSQVEVWISSRKL